MEESLPSKLLARYSLYIAKSKKIVIRDISLTTIDGCLRAKIDPFDIHGDYKIISKQLFISTLARNLTPITKKEIYERSLPDDSCHAMPINSLRDIKREKKD